ncbi:MAG: SMC-Scp complex subunit ScpB [Syntrophales bacterium]|jgi:segregation and condensation protein B|nr:SMC-Scp complex subunit ScpB [Syntrophales bacterium]MCK9528092.1 SMC-Scp complex subunit ScpB [Syntrophales bacterium]MDX9922312.1 SMC-Scp complex subunit ScpB [Syntrophales bacterium]
MKDLESIVESLIFVSETPLSTKKLQELLDDASEQDIHAALLELKDRYAPGRGGLYLAEVAGGFQFRTADVAAPWIQKLRGGRPAMLSRAAMETLAVVAYRQPVLKGEIEQVRGVDVSTALRGLLEKNLVRIVGRKDVPGKPIMYGTTKRFLEVFNLRDLSELPTLREMKELEESEPRA